MGGRQRITGQAQSREVRRKLHSINRVQKRDLVSNFDISTLIQMNEARLISHFGDKDHRSTLLVLVSKQYSNHNF